MAAICIDGSSTVHITSGAPQKQGGQESMSMVQDFIEAVERPIDIVATHPTQSTNPVLGLVETIDMACDVLYDAEIERVVLSRLGSGNVYAEDIHITMPDGSKMTAMTAFFEDYLGLRDEETKELHNFQPYGDAGLRLFQNIDACNNSNSSLC